MKLIKTIYSLTIGEFAEYKETKDLRIFRKWFNPFPVHWFDLSQFFDEFNNLFNATTELNNEVYRLKSYNIITMLTTMYKMAFILMEAQNSKTVWAIIFKLKHKATSSNLEIYRAKIKQLTRIDIFDKDGLTRLQKEIQRRVDKYNENTIKHENTGEVDFMELVYGVFSTAKEPYNKNLTIYEFAKLKNRADKIIKQTNKPKADGRD